MGCITPNRGMEREEDYTKIAKQRVKSVIVQEKLFDK